MHFFHPTELIRTKWQSKTCDPLFEFAIATANAAAIHVYVYSFHIHMMQCFLHARNSFISCSINRTMMLIGCSNLTECGFSKMNMEVLDYVNQCKYAST